MSQIKVLINNKDVTSKCVEIGTLKEYTDQSRFFAGSFRFSTLVVIFQNNNAEFNERTSIFPGVRNNSVLKVFYKANNPDLDDRLVFEGLINEGATDNNLTSRLISFTVQSYLKYLQDLNVISPVDQASIDRRYKSISGTDDIQLNKLFIACFLYEYLYRESNKLNKIFNVFTNNSRNSYPNINASIESIFPPSDSYYSSNNESVLALLNNLISALNSYSTLIFKDKAYLHIKPRPFSKTRAGSKDLNNQFILKILKKTEGHNKLFNKVIINGSEPYVNQSSINRYGVRLLNINSFAPASQALADSYLSFYSNPKSELNLVVKMNHETLDYSIGDILYISQIARSDFKLSPLSGYFAIFEKKIKFDRESIDLRLREI